MPDQQEDLTDTDHLVVQTGKVAGDEDQLPILSQSPEWVPASVVDDQGEWVQR